MPQILHTPESLLPRTDSRNPATTCRGITQSGNPCRRSNALSPRSSPRKKSFSEVSLVVNQENKENLYCWQHKDQVPHSPGNVSSVQFLKSRNSFDTILEHIGVLSTRGDAPTKAKSRPVSLEEEDEVLCEKRSPVSRRQKQRNPFSFLFCWAPVEDDEYLEVVRHRDRKQGGRGIYHESGRGQSSHCIDSSTPSSRAMYYQQDLRYRASHNVQSSGDMPSSHSPYQWQQFVPLWLSPTVQAQLIAEMAKPISPADEDGYIYMFWLTDNKISTTPDLDSFLDQKQAADIGSPRVGKHRSGPATAQSARHESSSSQSDHCRDNLLVKIGRATNVHRRLASWSQQCGYKLSLIRFYPHVPVAELAMESPKLKSRNKDELVLNNGNTGSGPNVRKVPYSHRVERLIHLELSEQRAQQGRCQVCGKSHREWFEVAPSREGLKKVDEVVNRWVAWAERLRDTTIAENVE